MLTIKQHDVILRMNWLEFNRVHINYFDKFVMFSEFELGEDQMFMSSKQLEKSLKDDACVFLMFTSFKAERKVVVGDIPVVCDFPGVLPNDVSDLPPEREVEFAVD